MPEFTCPGPITVDIRIAGGSLNLIAEPRDTALVEISPYDGSAASREAAEQTRVELDGDTLQIASPEPGGWAIRWRSARIRVVARVPLHSAGRFKAAAADVSCRGEWSQISLGSASGDADFDELTGDLSANTASGDLTVGRVGGQLSARSASGNIVARRVAGAVEVKTASGHVRIDETDGDVTVKTASGDVRVGAARTGTAQLTTVTGDLSIGVVAGTGVWLDLNSVTGQTRSDLTVGADAGPVRHSLTIRARAVSGNVDVHRVTPATDERPAA